MGRPMSIQGKIRDCARIVLAYAVCGSDNANTRYQMAYFGKAMRSHLEFVRNEKLILPTSVREIAERAEKVLVERCDGKDCSFKQ